jgi:hypothetical protein
LPAHAHSAEVVVGIETTGDLGYPVFQETNDLLRDLLTAGTQKMFADSTNEDVADRIFEMVLDHLEGWRDDPARNPVLARWGGEYRLAFIELGVVGVHDVIGHDEGTAYYRVERTGTQPAHGAFRGCD